MNTLETRSVLNSELPRGVAPNGPRVVKKYPNRRLYDTAESRYITLADIRRLVMEQIDFVVIDKKSQDDITRSILLQVIAEQEQAGEPLMSRDFLAQIICSHGGSMPGLVGSYLEQSLKLFSNEQRDLSGADTDVVCSLAHMNIDRWRALQEEIFEAMSRAGSGSNGKIAVDELADRN